METETWVDPYHFITTDSILSPWNTNGLWEWEAAGGAGLYKAEAPTPGTAAVTSFLRADRQTMVIWTALHASNISTDCRLAFWGGVAAITVLQDQ